ncbi:[weak similarity to] transposase IS3/IS911 family protein, partial [methanotrophic bacterial endosymbiont of Bathymodiolus sp.]
SLGVSLSAIGRWVRAERGPTIGTKATPSLSGQTELVRLRKEVCNGQVKQDTFLDCFSMEFMLKL